MKKTLKKLALFLLLIHIVLLANTYAVLAAPSSKPSDLKTPFEKLQEITGQSLPQYEVGGQGQGPHGDLGTSNLASEEGVVAVASPIMYAIDFFRFAGSGIAVVVIVIASIKLISTSTEEEATKTKTHLTMAVIGLIIIQLADVAVKKVFFGETGDIFTDRGAYLEDLYLKSETGGVEFFRGLVGFVNVFIAAVAVLVLVIRGFTLIVSGGDEEALTKAKKHILYAIVGLVVVGISEVVVRGVIFPAKIDHGEVELGMVDVDKANQVIIGLTNYMASFISILAFVALFFAGYKYVVSGGNEEAMTSVKKTIVGALIALLIALGAFAIVNSVMDIAEPDEPTAQSFYLTWHRELPYQK